jgi:hypothetical protein
MYPKARKVSAKEAAKLLASIAHADDPDMSHGIRCKAYALADGSALLVFENGRGLLYESHHEMVARYRADVERAKHPSNPLTELVPQGETFAGEVPNLIAALAKRLRLDPGALDMTEGSLDAVDRALRKMSARRILTSSEVFAPLTAYLGEVIRQAIDGRWEMRQDAYDRTWIPWIVDSAGWSSSPVRIHKEFLEHGRSASTRVFVRAMIGVSRTVNRQSR